MERIRTTDYVVVSLSGHSQGGGVPDTTANKIMGNWYLQPGTPGKELSAHAIPMDAHKGKILLKVWFDNGPRGKLVHENGSQEMKLDHGVISEDVPMGNGSIHRTITLRGNWLLTIKIEVKPIPDTSIPKQTEALPRDITTTAPRVDATETEIISTSPVAIVPTNENTPVQVDPPLTTGEVVISNLETSAVTSASSTDSEPPDQHTQRRTTGMKKHQKQNPLIDWILSELASRLNIGVEEVKSPAERHGLGADARNLAIHLLKDLVGIKPISQLLPVFTPKSQNTGGLYGHANKGKELAKNGQYSEIIADIVMQAKQKIAGESIPPAAKGLASNPSRRTRSELNGSGGDLVQNACICALIEAGIPADQVANSFNVQIEGVYIAIGQLTITNNLLIQKVRKAVGKTTSL